MRRETATWMPTVSADARVDPSTAPQPPPVYPVALVRLFDAPAATRGAAWSAFLEEYSRLLLHTAHSVSASRDDAMDAYAHVLDQLRDQDFRRLRAYAADPRSRFTTWLVVVARRLCVDLYRARHGRDRHDPRDDRQPDDGPDDHRARRRLADLTAADVDVDTISDERSVRADAGMLEAELQSALAAAVGELPPADRLLLKLRFDDGLTASEIARAFRLPTPFHVYRRVNALLAGLRGALRDRGVEGPCP